MSLIGALNVGKSALAVHQAAIQVTGNNIANAGNADYTRQTASISPNRDQELRPGLFLGTGVNLSAVQRQIDEALQGRLRAGVSDSEGAATTEQWLSRVEAVFNELGDDDLSSRLSAFFGSWSNLANKPQDAGLRQVVLQTGDNVARFLTGLRTQLDGLQTDVDARLTVLVKEADGLAQKVADLNRDIVTAEGGGAGTANGLRDQRDAVLKRLAELVDIRTVPQANGTVNVHVGSEPVVIGTESRGFGLKQEGADGRVTTSVTIRSTGGEITPAAGQFGGLVGARKEIGTVIEQVDALAGGLIFELNKLHAAGQGLQGIDSVTSTNAVNDPTVALNDPAADLPFVPSNGSFVVHVRAKATGLVTSTLVQVDLDGVGADTTLDSLRADLNAVPDVTASVVGGKLTIAALSDNVEISFSQDSSGVLAALGVNSFYTGSDARDIAVNQALKDNPALIAAAKNGEPTDNQTARAIAALETQSLASLGGASLKGAYESAVSGVATKASAAKTDVEAAAVVMETLIAQRESLSGVSLDEEAINLMRQQRAFQGAARLITAVDELMRTVLSMI